MKRWYLKNKGLLIFFGFTTLIVFLITLLEVELILSNVSELETYATTNVMSDSLKTVGLVGLLNVAGLTVWTFLFMFIILKIIFPDKRTMRNALFLDELRFLKDMPGELRKGLDRR